MHPNKFSTETNLSEFLFPILGINTAKGDTKLPLLADNVIENLETQENQLNKKTIKL